MKQGHLVHNNWLLGALAVLLLAVTAVVTTLSGEVSVELGGVAMSFQPHDEGGVRLFFVQVS